MTKRDELINILSNIGRFYIFGTGQVARRLFLLIEEFGYKDAFCGFVVSKKEINLFDGEKVFSIDEIDAINVQNQSILVSVSEVYHPDVYIILRGIFSNVISGIDFFSLELGESVEVPDDCVNLEYEIPHDLMAVRDKIIKAYFSKRHAFGESSFYQSFPSLAINGIRSTELRIRSYGFKSIFTKEDTVLDIGCNCGFLDMEIAKFVNSIDALEYDVTMSEFSNYAKKLLNIDNINFISGDFREWEKTNNNKYSFIISSAVHIWIAMKPEDYSEVICRMLLPGGKLLFESQDMKGDKEFGTFCEAFMNNGMIIIKQGHICDDGKTDREFVFMKKM